MTFASHPLASRRRFLQVAAGSVAAASLQPAVALAVAAPSPRDLALYHTHTREDIELVYALGRDYVTDALGELNVFLRDHRTGDIGRMDPRLYDLMHQIRLTLGSAQPFEIISGYRSPATNEMLRTTRGGGVARRSLHMDGRAIDVRLPGVRLADLREAALSLRAGGVGYYPREQFVHIDTGPVRSW
ncbi:MAG: DUF882 domain-containing protein [Burkholderiales bacterium]|nr:MAG: DUF882 domain-containing protein [Burkholderiales bacterium]